MTLIKNNNVGAQVVGPWHVSCACAFVCIPKYKCALLKSRPRRCRSQQDKLYLACDELIIIVVHDSEIVEQVIAVFPVVCRQGGAAGADAAEQRGDRRRRRLASLGHAQLHEVTQNPAQHAADAFVEAVMLAQSLCFYR